MMIPTRADDIKLLKMLDLRDHEGMGSTQIGEAVGLSRSAAVGALSRVKRAEVPCACSKPENMDGGMPRGWWK